MQLVIWNSKPVGGRTALPWLLFYNGQCLSSWAPLDPASGRMQFLSAYYTSRLLWTHANQHAGSSGKGDN